MVCGIWYILYVLYCKWYVVLVCGIWCVAYGMWYMAYAVWPMVYDIWYIAYGIGMSYMACSTWNVVFHIWHIICGIWYIVYVLWLVVCGFTMWCVAYGTWYMAYGMWWYKQCILPWMAWSLETKGSLPFSDIDYCPFVPYWVPWETGVEMNINKQVFSGSTLGSNLWKGGERSRIV